MRKQLKLLSSNKTWSANGRYKVNEVVTFDGQDYQNVTGANSSPDDLVDWFLVDSGFTPTLQQVSDEGGLSNGATVRQGTTNAGLGGNKGIALRCSIDYELKWEAGRLYAMESDGFTIRETSYNFDIAPTDEDDESKGFVVGSRWILDNGDTYVCIDQATGSAIWELIDVTGSLEQYKTSDFTAENGVFYTTGGSDCVITDPTPIIGKGYKVFAIRTQAIISGVTYIVGSLVYRYYSVGGWLTIEMSNIEDIATITSSLGNKVDKGVNNSTTIALTTSDLNTAYPDATTGYRVYCTSIIAGAMVYEKTPTGWVGTAVIIP